MAGCITIPLGTQVGLGPDDTVLDRDPALPPKRFTVPPNFQPMSIVAKWLPISATAELLSNVYYVFIYFVFGYSHVNVRRAHPHSLVYLD